uniref:Uncharacterized protein n=1 Tax=Bubo bubo TaxID=30461 RepID=A0A8C0EGQ7_BUBBB
MFLFFSLFSRPELNHKGRSTWWLFLFYKCTFLSLYCPWRGQLSIRGQLLCNIALRTPYSSTIPAQLPPNLDVYHVMGLSDLKKKLPEAAFGKKNYIENEGECTKPAGMMSNVGLEEILEQKNFAVKFRGVRLVRDLAFVKLLWGSECAIRMLHSRGQYGMLE